MPSGTLEVLTVSRIFAAHSNDIYLNILWSARLTRGYVLPKKSREFMFWEIASSTIPCRPFKKVQVKYVYKRVYAASILQQESSGYWSPLNFFIFSFYLSRHHFFNWSPTELYMVNPFLYIKLVLEFRDQIKTFIYFLTGQTSDFVKLCIWEVQSKKSRLPLPWCYVFPLALLVYSCCRIPYSPSIGSWCA